MKYILIYVLNLCDYAQTVYWTGIHGIEAEINPVMRWVLGSPWAFAAVKLFLFPVFLYWMYRKKHDDTAYIALGMFIVTVLMNFRTIFAI